MDEITITKEQYEKAFPSGSWESFVEHVTGEQDVRASR